MPRTSILPAALLAVILQAGPAGACYLEGIPNGFTVAHPGAVSMALATRKAITSGFLEALPANQKLRRAMLYRIGLMASSHVRRLAAVGTAGPPVSVLLVQSGTWLRLNDPTQGAVYHSDPSAGGESVILLPDQAYAGLMRGAYSVAELERQGLWRVYADEPEMAQAVWMQAVEVLAKRQSGQF